MEKNMLKKTRKEHLSFLETNPYLILKKYLAKTYYHYTSQKNKKHSSYEIFIRNDPYKIIYCKVHDYNSHNFAIYKGV